MKLTAISAAVSAVFIMVSSAPISGESHHKPNVLLVTVDTLRADRLSAYGYDRRTTPNIDALIEQGVRFEKAHTTIPLTCPSFASTFTSRYPHETGATRNGLPMESDFPTLAQIMRSNGYRTGAVISNWTLKKDICGINGGFDYYNESFLSKRNLFIEEQDAKDVTDIALAWLRGTSAEKPYFAWIHYSDPHHTYEARRQVKFRLKKGETTESNSYRYDGEVAYTDHHVGRLLKELEACGMLKNTLIIFHADHGESLGEHNYTGHGRQVYEQTMRVPFAIVGPGIKKGVNSTSDVLLVDVLPTVLTFLGISLPAEIRGVSLFEGGVLTAKQLRTEKYIETFRGAVPDVAGAKKMAPGVKPQRIGMIENGWKLINSPEENTRELYNLAEDPQELNDLSKKFPERTAVMTRKSWEWYGRTGPKNPPKPRHIPPDVRKRLEALGYLQ